MKKVFIETSVFIRFLTKDDENKFIDCIRLFELIDSGKLRPYISNIIILEIFFVLTEIYKFPKRKVLKDIGALLELRNLTIIEKTDTVRAMSLFKKYKASYADCLIACQVPKGVCLITYDTHFSKINLPKVVAPSNI